LTKARLLSSSIKIRERIKNSGNVELIKTYNLWTKKNELLTQALSMSSAQLAENEIDTKLLTGEVDQLERDISQQSEIFGQSFENKRVTYENIQKSLAKNEVALEIVRYRHFDHIFTDSVVYVGLYVKSDNARPKVIHFPYGNQLETHFFRGYRNSVQYRVPDKFSYDAFWAPVEKQIGSNYGTLYLSADGVFNQVNLETLPLPGQPGQYILDKFNIVYVNNTKDLYLRKSAQKSPQKSNTASLVGNPAFYSPKVKDRAFTDLPGTAMEVNEVRQLLASKGWNASMLTETSATEEQVKSVENPKIFHIATHGFYSPAVEKNIDSELTETESQLSENPLMKSGLLLKGGGDILSLMPYNYNAENGVLTAYEAMSLNLDQT
ncbi:MAG: CHAT domain-containing protein, partial [Bacteroidota bacterium]